MHTNVILTNRRRIHTKPNYTNRKLKGWLRRLLRHPARKRSGSTQSEEMDGWAGSVLWPISTVMQKA